ncbi:hypothetical protein PAERUG_P41_London_28_09_12_04885 [Pseudomonas aeruginosa]|nr:hypothetical protein PAERUG_P41_London_28_09_12_04885 [Pseudomonas aeruginosa]
MLSREHAPRIRHIQPSQCYQWGHHLLEELTVLTECSTGRMKPQHYLGVGCKHHHRQRDHLAGGLCFFLSQTTYGVAADRKLTQ